MTYYIGLVHKDKDSAYGVQFPDVPGCVSASDDMDHVVSNATKALACGPRMKRLPFPAALKKLFWKLILPQI
jgi:hypothetical protein